LPVRKQALIDAQLRKRAARAAQSDPNAVPPPPDGPPALPVRKPEYMARATERILAARAATANAALPPLAQPGAANPAPPPPPDPAELKQRLTRLIQSIPGTAGGNAEARRQLLALSIEAGKQLNARDVFAAEERIADLQRALAAAAVDANPPPPPPQ